MPHVSSRRWDAATAILLGGLVIAHYAIQAHVLWIHMFLFWLFQIPILIGGITRGVRGGIATATIASLLLLPHAVGLTRHHGLSANAIWMDLTTLFVIGFATGWLRDRWRTQEEMGERIRSLENLRHITGALTRDLQSSLPAIRGALISLEPMRSRMPAMAVAVQTMDESLMALETLTDRLRVLRLHPRLGLARLDKIVAAAENQLARAPGHVPSVTVDWQCRPPVIPASISSVSSSLAVFVLQMGSRHSQVQLRVARKPHWVVLSLNPRGTTSFDISPPIRTPETSLELATHVIKAHGGFVNDDSESLENPSITVSLPSVLRLRTVSRDTDFTAAEENGLRTAKAMVRPSPPTRSEATKKPAYAPYASSSLRETIEEFPL